MAWTEVQDEEVVRRVKYLTDPVYLETLCTAQKS